LILNAVNMFHARVPQAARNLLDRAEAIFLQHMQAKNRLRYLLGVLLGCAVSFLFGVSLIFVSVLTEQFIPRTHLLLVVLFACMGTIASVMLRLSSIDLREQTNITLILISGLARPITAVLYALVLYLLVMSKFIEVHIGPADEAGSKYFFLLVSFLCGFSERFASDILSRFGGALGSLEAPKSKAQPTTQIET
jgi:hypothetical protein